MADTFKSLADLVLINDQNLADLEVSDLLTQAPVIASLPASPASNGTLHKYTKETGAPVVGFRAVNDGRENRDSTDTLVTVTLQILDCSFACDIEIAKAYKRGRDAYLEMELMRHLRQAMFHAERQIWYGTGTGGDSVGFAGLGDNTGYNHKDDTMVVDATGTTATTGSSVWLYCVKPDDSGVQVVGGNDGNIEVEDPVIQRVAGSATGTLPMFYTAASGYLGFQIGSAYDVARICNLTADSGKGLTDALISQAIEKIPAHNRPFLRIAMNRRSQAQLQQSRTATNSTGTPAPFPQESFGVPIVVTDSILSTEALLAAA